ncbi:MAG TPA: phosphoenolpyruvate carboxylase [Pyrinomonadaceae bacterium]|nr:phosphoenolpyruvate carboxylase [Pyrinomonadaceae bacterium]
MIQTVSGALEKFQNSVGIKFQLYNSLFLSLPFYGVDKTGILLSLFNTDCEAGFANGKSPQEIIETFFENYSEKEKLEFLFRFVQYTERQVVLFDALEDAAFCELHDVNGAGTLTQLEARVLQENNTEEFAEKVNNFNVRLVLTAHPTQFYPGTVLGIINDLVEAIEKNDVSLINTYLQQLGRTPFFKKQKPTPFDEAQSLIWYLENVFYEAIGNIASDLKNSFPKENFDLTNLVKMGFWSGGDRDGNPFVTTEITLKTAEALRLAALRCYYRDTRKLKRRLTFTGVDAALSELENKLYLEAFSSRKNDLTKDDVLQHLYKIRAMIIENHNGLFVHLVDNLLEKVNTFGLYFASLDIRQDSSVHAKVLSEVAEKTDALTNNYNDLSDAEKIETLSNVNKEIDAEIFTDELTRDTIQNIAAVREIQAKNGEKACHRYIISHSETALNIIEVFGLFLLGGWKKEDLSVDIVPLFETIADLKEAAKIMRELYENPIYREHLASRNNTQTIMLGFSDGTKDGGYLMANWSIYKAKDELTRLAKDYGISVIFFDGRGGPPARGGGKTHKFYSSMGAEIANDAIELTIQGQTVSSNFGTVDAAQFNIEQLLHAGIYNHLFAAKEQTFTPQEEELMQNLAESALQSYEELKNHPHFLDYLSDVSPLKFYAETNIGSRPAKRGSGKLTLDDLRAIPFVGAWSQLKQNVPGFYGVGSALRDLSESLDAIRELYHSNLFFKTLIDNCEMAMQKSDFQLTEFLSEHEIYGKIWQMIHDEYELCREYLEKITGKKALMSDFPVEQQSVQTRERIVLPLTTIQQYALTKIRESNDEDLKNILGKLVIRCSFGIINAGRNSA